MNRSRNITMVYFEWEKGIGYDEKQDQKRRLPFDGAIGGMPRIGSGNFHGGKRTGSGGRYITGSAGHTGSAAAGNAGCRVAG